MHTLGLNTGKESNDPKKLGTSCKYMAGLQRLEKLSRPLMKNRSGSGEGLDTSCKKTKEKGTVHVRKRFHREEPRYSGSCTAKGRHLQSQHEARKQNNKGMGRFQRKN